MESIPEDPMEEKKVKEPDGAAGSPVTPERIQRIPSIAKHMENIYEERFSKITDIRVNYSLKIGLMNSKTQKREIKRL